MITGPNAMVVRVQELHRLASGRIRVRYTDPESGATKALAMSAHVDRHGYPAGKPFVVYARGIGRHDAQVSDAALVALGPPPSGDTTGATDTAALAAIAADGVTIRLRPTGVGRPYYVTRLPTVTPRRGLIADQLSTVVMHVGAGSCLTIRNPHFPSGGGQAIWVDNMAGRVGGFIIDGSRHRGTGAKGVEAGDIYALNAADIVVRNYTAAGDVGFWLNNTIGWTERGQWRNCHADNCTRGVVWDRNGGTSSFDYSTFDFTVRSYANQDGYVFQNGTAFDGCAFHLGGNFEGGESNNGVAVRIGSDDTAVFLRDVELIWQFETDHAGAVHHTTINLGAAAFVRGHGIVKFLNSHNWRAGNVTQPTNQFSFSGLVDVDENLGLTQVGEGLNVLGGSTWSRGQNTVSGGNAAVAVATGDYFSVPLASGGNVMQFHSVYGGRARRIVLLLKQPATGSSATVDWTNPGNNVQGVAQVINWSQGGGSSPALQTALNAADVVQLITVDGVSWYGSLLTTATAPTQGLARPMQKATSSITPGVSSAYGTPVTVAPAVPAVGLVPNAFSWSIADGDGGETISLQIVVTYDDASTTTFTTAGVIGNVTASQSLDDSDKINFYQDGRYITAFTIAATSTAGTTAATVTAISGSLSVI